MGSTARTGSRAFQWIEKRMAAGTKKGRRKIRRPSFKASGWFQT